MTPALRVVAVLSVSALLVSVVGSCGGNASAAPAAHVPDSYHYTLELTRRDGTQTSMEIFGFAHRVDAPRDAASGLPTGKRQHKPLVVTKLVDASTPLLLQSLLSHEIFETLMITARRTRGGMDEIAFSILLTDPWVHAFGTPDDPDDTTEAHETREHVSFCYQKITWTYTDGGTTAEDDWIQER